MKYQVILFDLDGTLIDPVAATVGSLSLALKEMGIHASSDQLKIFIGKTVQDGLIKHYQLSKVHSDELITRFKRIFLNTGYKENTLHNGILDLLSFLHGKQVDICLATQKPLESAEKILGYLKIRKYFKRLGANNWSYSFNKTEIVKEILTDYKNISGEQIIMIGDSEADINAAKNNKIASIAVAWGMGQIKNLKKYEPTFLAKDIEDLKRILIKT